MLAAPAVSLRIRGGAAAPAITVVAGKG